MSLVSPEPLPRSFYDRNAIHVAPDLLGCLLVRKVPEGLRVGRIVEAEAYVGEHDLACHSRAGRTPRTEVMFGEPGHAYVYLVYGIHRMLNAVCGPGPDANAVLIRAAAPFEGELPGALPLLHSATGPGNVCRAFGIDLRHNRADLCDPRSELSVAPRPSGAPPRVWRASRVGVEYSGHWARKLLRFCDRDSPHVSRPLPG